MKRFSLFFAILAMIVSLSACGSPEPDAASQGPGEAHQDAPYMIFFDSIYGITELFEAAEDPSAGFDSCLSQVENSSSICTPEDVLALRDMVQDIPVPHIASLGGFKTQKAQFTYFNYDFSDVYFFSSYGFADSELARMQFYIYEGEIALDWEVGKNLVDSWKVDEYSIRVFEHTGSQHFDRMGYCQFEEHYLYFRFKSDDLELLKQELEFHRLGSISR